MGMQDTLRALADPTRREILNLLKKSRLSAGEIGDHFSISGAAVSRHLSVLKEADLIAAEDTRNSIRLLNHFDIHTPMTSYHEYNKIEKA